MGAEQGRRGRIATVCVLEPDQSSCNSAIAGGRPPERPGAAKPAREASIMAVRGRRGPTDRASETATLLGTTCVSGDGRGNGIHLFHPGSAVRRHMGVVAGTMPQVSGVGVAGSSSAVSEV